MKAQHTYKPMVRYLLSIGILSFVFCSVATGEGIKTVRYRLIEGSILVDDCTICGRPPLPIPIRGSFWLEKLEENPLFADYLVKGLTFKSAASWFEYEGRLEGTYRIGGEVAIVQQMTLRGRINKRENLEFDSELVPTQAPFPWIEIDLRQLPPTDPLQTFSFHIVAVPWPRVLFSTETSFTSSSSGIRQVSDGDLLNSSGRVIYTNSELTARLGITPPAPEIGLDAVMGHPGMMPPPLAGSDWPSYEILFSVEQDIFSEKLGMVGQGDILSNAGYIFRRNSELVKAFLPESATVDYGLDALALGGPDGSVLFSTEEGFFSKRLGESIGDGDLLCEDGFIFKRIGDLLANFHPIEPRPIPFGLDAVYVWPHGEVWFSIEVDFADGQLGTIGHGDLLSDRGRVVVRNSELIAPFRPVGNVGDVGLDSLQVIPIFCAADFNMDRVVNLADLATFAAGWMSKLGDMEWNPDCDINIPADDIIDTLDLVVFAEEWLVCGCL